MVIITSMRPRLSPPLAQKVRQDTSPFPISTPPKPYNRSSKSPSQGSARDSLPASRSHPLFTHSKPVVKVGVVVGETKTAFLIRHRAEWTPIRKEAFEKDLRTLAKLKGRKVQILGLDHGMVKVVLLPRDADLKALEEEYDSNSSFEQETVPNLDTATDRQVQLNLSLLQDIISLTSLSTNPDRTRNYAHLRLHSLQEELESTFNSGEVGNLESVQEAATACKHLVSSMEFNLKDMKVVCSDCKVAAAKVQLSCNHSLCSDCCKELVVYTSGSELKALRCPSCFRDLTTTDARLILLEKYHLLQKNLKYAQLVTPSA